MHSLRFIHAADLHLDSPFQGLQCIDEQIADTLRDASFQTLDRIVNLSLERQVDFLVIAGDVYDSANRSLRAQIRLRDALARLHPAGISVYIIHGNHDPLDGWRATLTWPDNVHIFTGAEVQRVLHIRDKKPIAAIYGLSYPQRDVRDNLAKKYRRRPDDPFAIGLLHANVDGDPAHEAYAPCTHADLVKTGMDYWALGHIHTHRILTPEAPAVVYPGNPQGRHPGESGRRGCCLVNVNEAGRPSVAFVETDAVRWILEELPVHDLESEQALFDAIEETLELIQDRENGRDLVCRLRLTGRSPLHPTLRRPRFIEEETERLREHFAIREPFVWIDRIEVRTQPPIDMDDRAKSADFIGDFLRLVRQWQTDPDRRAQLRTALEPLFAQRIFLKYLNQPSDETLSAWLDEALLRALDLMMEDR